MTRFRVWDREENRWASVATIVFRPADDDSYSLSSHGNSKFLIQPFTGLKDQVGRDIFEGDILNSKANRWVVVFEDGCFKAKSVFGLHLNKLKFLSSIADISFVVGNILETPDKINVYDFLTKH